MKYQNLVTKLNYLKKFGLVAIKQSLEDEGAGFEDIIIMRKLTKEINLKLNVKIGGCEAKNDIFFCDKIKVDGIVAPMVESKYALHKFITTIKHNIKFKKIKLFFNLETIQAYNDLTSILKVKNLNLLHGLVIGRSDLVGSMNLEKSDVNSKKVYILVNNILSKIYKKKIVAKMGGSITPKSLDFIKKLNLSKKLNKIETRNCEFLLNKNLFNNFEEILLKVYDFEISWLIYKAKKIYTKNTNRQIDFKKRIVEMKQRINS